MYGSLKHHAKLVADQNRVGVVQVQSGFYAHRFQPIP